MSVGLHVCIKGLTEVYAVLPTTDMNIRHIASSASCMLPAWTLQAEDAKCSQAFAG